MFTIKYQFCCHYFKIIFVMYYLVKLIITHLLLLGLLPKNSKLKNATDLK